ncbi:hypothetical protein SESBI_36795 [Sesbania bispinosa]|nr:hypothetical protein SESBI_36795 [Sesbania bispinosa]
MAAEKLRDLSQPIDVPLLDATVAAFYGTGSKEQVRPRFLFYFSHFLSFALSASDSTFGPVIRLCLPHCLFSFTDHLVGESSSLS